MVVLCIFIVESYFQLLKVLTLLEIVRAGVEDLVHDAAEDGVLHRREHEPHVVRVSGDGDVGVDLCSGIVQFNIMTS